MGTTFVPDPALGEAMASGDPQNSRTRFEAATVVTCDTAFSLHTPGVVDVSDDRIAWVGPAAQAPEHDGGTIKCEGLLMPGLVNTHAHSPMTLLRGVGEGLTVDRWLREVIWPREAHLDEEDVFWGMVLACDELLRCGVTTSCETYFHDRRVVDAALSAGIRCVVTPGIVDLPGAGEEWTWQRLLDKAENLHAEANGRDGLVTIGFGPHSAYALPPDALAAAAAAAREVDALVSLHVAESADEGRHIEATRGVTVPRYLADLGVLDSRVLAAHCVWVTQQDLDLFRRFDVAVAHCPQSNAKLGSGIARLEEFVSRGLRVGLGTDGPASNNDLDLWEEMRLAPMLARATQRDATAVGAEQAIRLATRGGGEALGIDVGELVPGRLADLVHLDIDDPRFVPIVDESDVVSHLLWSSSSRLVKDVWVGGRQVVRDGRCVTVGEREARAEVQRRAERIADRART
jgi:5-methylthioadenosine/S-adenosylhomocysteine deaminase